VTLLIAIARKPLSHGSVAQNALEWQCGGLAINLSRVVTVDGDNPPVDHKAGGGHFENWRTGNKACLCGGHALGRYPANLILQHCATCIQTGVKQVQPKEGHRPNPVGLQSDGHLQFNAKPVGYQKISYTDRTGKESIVSWICAEGCPVKEIDRQSGERPGMSGGGEERQPRGFGGMWSGISNAPCDPQYGDVGAASRFFKQVKG